MPFRRTVRYASPLVAWHELVLLEAAPAWSDPYRAETPRLFIPGSRWIEADLQGRRWVCDALTPLALTSDLPYRTRQPHAGQRSIVLVFDVDGGSALRRSTPVRLGPAAQWQLASCRAALDRGRPDPLGLEEALMALLTASMPGELQGGPAEQRVDRAVARARELLACDPSASHSLQEIARAVGASPFHLARHFRRTHGTGLHGYRTQLRMVQALARLGEGEDDLTRLALDLGYSSHSHFSARFRTHFGTTPRHARALFFGSAGI